MLRTSSKASQTRKPQQKDFHGIFEIGNSTGQHKHDRALGEIGL